jgi:hypothetical protein
MVDLLEVRWEAVLPGSVERRVDRIAVHPKTDP